MRHLFALFTALVFTAAACAGEPASSPSAGLSVMVQKWSERYDAAIFSSSASVPFLFGKSLIAYEPSPEYDEDGVVTPGTSSSVLISDGTESGTVSLLDGNLVRNDDGVPNAVELEGVGYFLARPSIVAGETEAVVLYATDGSVAGTREIDRHDAAAFSEGISTWLVGIGSGPSATLCVVVENSVADARPEIDCYRPNEAMRKVKLGTINLLVADRLYLALAQTGDRFYLTTGGAGYYPPEKTMALFSVAATATADDLAVEREEFPGTMVKMIGLGDGENGEAVLLVNQVALSETLDDIRFDLRRLDPDGTITMLISAPAEEFGHPTWGASFEAELSAGGSTIYLSSYDNTTAESTSWLYAFTVGEQPRVLSTGLLTEAPIYELYRAVDGRIGALDGGTFSWLEPIDTELGAPGLVLAASALTDHYFAAPIFLENGSVYLQTYTTRPELESEADPWYYLPPRSGEAVVFTTGSGLTTSDVTTNYAIAGRAAVYLVESRSPRLDVVNGEYVETGEYASRLYRLLDGVPTEFSIRQTPPEGTERVFSALYRLGDDVLLQTLLVRPDGSTEAELFELLP